MFRHISLRFFLIVLLLFFALFWDFNKGELRATIQTGVCEEFDYTNRSCYSGQNLIITSYPAMLIDPVALLMVLGLTYLGSWFRDGDLSKKIGTGVSHSKRCRRTGCDHWSCDFLFWDLFRAFLTHDFPHYFFSLPLWAIAGFYLDNSLELHEMQGRSVTRKIRIGFFDLVR